MYFQVSGILRQDPGAFESEERYIKSLPRQEWSMHYHLKQHVLRDFVESSDKTLLLQM